MVCYIVTGVGGLEQNRVASSTKKVQFLLTLLVLFLGYLLFPILVDMASVDFPQPLEAAFQVTWVIQIQFSTYIIWIQKFYCTVLHPYIWTLGVVVGSCDPPRLLHTWITKHKCKC